jgi:hypothetical protein
VGHRQLTSPDLLLKTDYFQEVYFMLSNIVIIGLNASLERRHPLEKNPVRSRFFRGPQDPLDRWYKMLPRLE